MSEVPVIARPAKGVWRHYKGALYIVLGTACHHETRELGVVYFPIAPHEEEDPTWNWRPLTGRNGWFTAVNLDLKDPMFTKLLTREGFKLADASTALFERFTFLYPINS